MFVILKILLKLLLLWSMLSSVSTTISFFSLVAISHFFSTVSHRSVCFCMLLLFCMLRDFGSVHCQYIDAISIGLFFGSFSSIHNVDVMLSSRSSLLLYGMSSLIIIMFL